jgi:hypothetical protein
VVTQLLLAVLLSAAPTPVSSAERSAIRKAYDGYTAACLRNDLPAVLGFLTDDVAWKSPDGRVRRRPQIDEEMRSSPRSDPGARCDSRSAR